MTKRIETETVKTHVLELTGREVVSALKEAGYDIPDAAEAFVVVPGGGVSRGDELDLDDCDPPLSIRWITRTIERC